MTDPLTTPQRFAAGCARAAAKLGQAHIAPDDPDGQGEPASRFKAGAARAAAQSAA